MVAKGMGVMSTISNQDLSHNERARLFKNHASMANNFDTRKKYLRLAEQELALAERLERLDQLRACRSPKHPRIW